MTRVPMDPQDDIHLILEPGQRAATFGVGQPEYRPLPVLVIAGPTRPIVTEWAAEGVRVRVTQLTFNGLLQPILVELVRSES